MSSIGNVRQLLDTPVDEGKRKSFGPRLREGRGLDNDVVSDQLTGQ
jgi:hypothetical protein